MDKETKKEIRKRIDRIRDFGWRRQNWRDLYSFINSLPENNKYQIAGEVWEEFDCRADAHCNCLHFYNWLDQQEE